MPVPYIGHGTSLGIGIEGTWGTAVARTNWKRLIPTAGLKRTRTTTPSPDLGRYGQASTNHRDWTVESDMAGGPIAFEVAYDDSSILLLSHILGAVTDGGSVGVYTHTLTLDSPVPIGLTMEQILGNSGQSQVFEGCKLDNTRLSIAAGGKLTCEAEVIGQTAGSVGATGTPTYSSNGELVQHHHAGGMTWNGNTYGFNSMTIGISRGLTRNHEVGSLFTSEPHETQLMIDIEIRRKWQDLTLGTGYLADTQSDLALTFTSSAKVLVLTAHNCKILDEDRGISSHGAIEQIIKMQAFADASDQGLSMVFTNANELYSAN